MLNSSTGRKLQLLCQLENPRIAGKDGAYKAYGPAWQKVASQIEGRTEDQCSKRYIEVLNPDTKDRLKPWTLEEDLQLIEGVKKYGTKWRTIAGAIKGRPSLTCRNRWRKIMTDVAKNNAGEEIMMAVGVLGPDGKPSVVLKQSENDDSNKNGYRDQNSNKSTESRNGIGRGGSDTIRKSNGVSVTASTLRDNVSETPSPASTNAPTATTTTFFNRANYASPAKSNTEWKFALLDPNTNEPVPSFSGVINTQELVHKLIDIAKYNGVGITVHQHIHHHYTPQSPVPDPETSITRYQHFNYLPPLAEVPKLTSSSSRENTIDSNGSAKTPKPPTSNGDMADNGIIKLLNHDHKSPAVKQVKSPPVPFNEITSTGIVPQPQLNPQSKQLSSLPPVNGSSNGNKQVRQSQSSRNGGGPLTEDLEEELDFWETMRTLTQPRPPSQKPVSQHHPLHYQGSSTSGIQTGSASTQTQNGNSKQRGLASNGNHRVNIGSMYMNDLDDEEDEEMEGYADQFGLYYNVMTNSAAKKQQGGASSHSDKSSSSSNGGYFLPFNPS
ncbi:unnamed protein product [Ambrosiozyma monospora]|uniref:Unnamed protein product n=1 Tax=Ambrosiozyma monospora TaxID=43982 RepID=A0ACB5SZR4_AMBMO|nr:unnamed protein product [Ambrosiozyma monospora]